MAAGTGNLPYPGKSYTPFDVLTAEELNEDVANIESLATGVGIGDGAITDRKKKTNIAFSAHVSGEQTLPSVDFTKINFGTEVFDDNGDFNPVTSTFTAPIAGKYQFNWSVYVNAGTKLVSALYVNGALRRRGSWINDAGTYIISTGSSTLKLDAGDLVTISAAVTGTTRRVSNDVAGTFFDGYYVGS